MTDEELIAELRRIGPLLLRRDGDDVARYGGGLLKEAADRLEDAGYVRQHGDDDLETGHTRDPEGDEAAHG